MTPGPWPFLLLALAAFRVFRIVARDTITEPVRAAVSYPDGQAVTLGRELEVPGHARPPRSWRVYAATLIRCPWCAGFYISVAVYAAWLLEPGWALAVASPLAISAAVGLAAKLDGLG